MKMKEEYESAHSSGARIIFIDEAVFSPQTMLEKSWSGRNESINVQDLRNRMKTEAIITGISKERGLECFMIKERSFNQDSYIEYL